MAEQRVIDPTRQGIDPPERRAPDDVDWTGRAKPIPLAEAISMVDAWPPDFAPFPLHQVCRVLREAYAEKRRDWVDAIEDIDRLIEMPDRAVAAWTAERKSAFAAVPCTAGIEDCHAPYYYRHQPCCNLRVALWAGEEFPTDYLPESGEVHLFVPGRGDKPRVSAGCVKLVEPD